MKRDLPVSEVVGIYESPPDRAVTTVRLNADHSFVMESWTCKTHDVMSGRWEQTGDGYVALSANPRSESEPAKTAEQSGLAEICRLDPQSCAVVRAEDVRVRIVGGVLELQFSSARDYVLKLHRRAQP
ncbi:MAG: hypothetical protein HY898_28670 [Deltaproteobacteria bacterium]|nr:hypothetical protein [Deltaproteobacteria bacterium]